MLERVQNDVSPDDIVTKAVLARPDSVLTLAGGDILELFDVVPAASVVGVVN